MGSGGSKHKIQGSRTYNQTERPSSPGKPYLIPGTPRSDPDVITIRWEPPIFIGGSKLTGYLVEHKRTGSPHWVKATPVLVRHNQLSLSGLEPGMRYQFRITAENSIGRSEPSQVSEPFAISFGRNGVAVAPVFIKTFTDTKAIENEKVEFFVKVDGTPIPKISWYKDGFELFSNRRQRVSTDGEISSFVIHQAALGDEGEIKCSATNKAGHAVIKASLTLEAPPTIRLPRQYEEGLLFELGEVMRLKISIAGRPIPKITWYHNGEEVKESSRIELAVSEKYAMLRIAEAKREDRGEYQIRAKNSIGDDMSSFLVTITDRPLPPGKMSIVMTLGKCVTLAWTSPNDDGGCKIGNYIVEYYRIGWNMWLKAATCRQLTTTIGDLIEGSEYKFRVKAENPYGISDPSEESDTVFIPDPKRGILEPPPKGSRNSTDSPDLWLEKMKTQIEQLPQKKIAEWDDESLIPSPVVLANQVLRKVKMAPKRTWSEDSQGSPPREITPIPVPPKRRHKPTDKIVRTKFDNDWDRDSSPQYSTTINDDLHSSSEMMLVLEVNSNSATEDRGEQPRLTAAELKEGSVAPPMSLSAPVLGSCEPIDPHELRAWGSSSELMHQLTLNRFNKEVDEEITELNVKKRYGIERKRSFERRPLKEISNSNENLTKKIENDKYDEYSERFQLLEQSFKNYSTKYSFDDIPVSDIEMDRSFDYSESEPIEEETYHPKRMGTFTPIQIQSTIPSITLNEETEDINKKIKEKSIKIQKKSRSSSPATPKNSRKPKPILKTKETHSLKKVRIETPNDGIDTYAREENNIGLFAGEVARNRRLKGTANDEMTVIVSHYSDIVKEFGSTKKGPPKLLSYEELKAAADKAIEQNPLQDFDIADKERLEVQEKTIKQNQQIVVYNNNLTLKRKPNILLEYIMDVLLFLFACWLYIFKDPKLVIPILFLLIYRQLSESVCKKFKFNWFKKT